MRIHRVVAVVACSVLSAAAFGQRAAEIVSVQGRGEQRPNATSEWQVARPKQGLDAGAYARTVDSTSKMALLLVDQTQLTLQGVSIVQVKSPEAAGERKSILEFGKGTGRFQTKTPTKNFTMGTPTGLAAIRGTEWLVEVDDDGRSAFTVVDGEIEISNELGSLPVGIDEQGILERGKAPTKVRLQNARERVQWVSSLTLDESRYGTGAADRELAAIERALYLGQLAAATQRLESAATRFPSDARLPALAARAALLADDFPRARAAAANALARFPDSIETQLAAGEVARLDGDFLAARNALRRATLIAPKDWRGWHALGRLMAERSDWREARRALDEAGKIAPGSAQVLAQRGMIEANAYDLPSARELLDRALDAQADDFSTWTGQGEARLRSGDVDGAIEALLKATLLEPRYARAHVNLAIAYWQKGRADDAFKELATASLHDPRDPVPYQLAAMMKSDLLMPGDALASAREAVARLPYVKSLDAIANNLRGSANLGAPLAQLGLEAWALKNAQDSFDPLWAGSHLFLGDRLPAKFASNSELLQGFITDPLAIGASNRFQALLPRPGTYGLLAWRGQGTSDIHSMEPSATLNGLVADGRVAYLIGGSLFRLWRVDGTVRERGSEASAALGFRPRDDFGLFVSYNQLNPENHAGDINAAFSPWNVVDGQVERYEAGMHWRPGPETQLWLAAAHESEDARLQERVTGTLGTARLLQDSLFTTQPRRNELGLRATRRFDSGLEASLTVERATFSSVDVLERDALARTSPAQPRLLESVSQDIRDESRLVVLAARWPVNPRVTVEAGAGRATYEKDNDIVVRRDFANQLTTLTDDHERDMWSGRAGAVARVGPLTVRAAWQHWLKPASTASLEASSTAGIALDDRFVLAGGRFDRTRAQLEWQATGDLLVQLFHDRQKVENLFSPLIGVLNNRPDTSNIARLRNRSFNTIASIDILEGVPVLSRGELRETGLAANGLVTRQLSAFAEATWSDSENTGSYPGKRFAFLPRRKQAFGIAWFTDWRFNMAAKWVRRSERFNDEANLNRIPAEWNGTIQAYWETRDKRWSVEGLVGNIGAKTQKDSLALAVTLRF